MTATSELLTLCSSDLLYAEGQHFLEHNTYHPAMIQMSMLPQGLHLETLTPKEMGLEVRPLGR